MKKIYEFKKGEEIVRIKPAKSLGPMETLHGQVIERGGDRSYMGEKLIFVGIANGQIYLQRTSELEQKIFGDKLLSLSVDLWDDGWNNWVDPMSLLNEDYEEKLSNEELKSRMVNALKREDYEEAERLKNLLKK